MNIKMSKLEKQYPNLETKHGVFPPIYSYSVIREVTDESQKVVDYEIVDFILIETAEEYYKKWFYKKENQSLVPQPTIKERIKSTEDTLLMLMDMQMGGI